MRAAVLALMIVVIGSSTFWGQQTTNGRVTVEGVANRQGTKEPVAKARVRLAGTTLPPVETDDQGHFIFNDVPPGTYIPVADRDGYRGPPAAAITVTAGRPVNNLVVELIPWAIISGRILDAKGEPVANAMVVASRYYYDETGHRSLSLEGSGGSGGTNYAKSNDRGEYRLFSLAPGRYFVGTSYPPTRNGVTLHFFFPGTLNESSAVSVTAIGGAELSGINLQFPPLADTPVFNVSGVILGAPPDVDGPVETFHLVPTGSVRRDNLLRNVAVNRTGGRFELQGIPPGTYDVYPDIRDDEGILFTSRTEIQVTDHNLEGLRIAVQKGPTLKGRLVLDGALTFANGKSLSEYLSGGEGITLGPQNAVPRAPEDLLFDDPSFDPTIDPKTATFNFKGVPPGQYRLRYEYQLPRGAYVGDVRQDNRSVFDNGITIGTEDVTTTEVVIKTDGAGLEGTVENSENKPVSAARVVLVPPLTRRQNKDLYRSANTNNDGRFVFANVAPGDYKIFAWEDVEQFSWLNADFLSEYETRGQPVRIEARTVPVRVRVIPRPDQ